MESPWHNPRGKPRQVEMDAVVRPVQRINARAPDFGLRRRGARFTLSRFVSNQRANALGMQLALVRTHTCCRPPPRMSARIVVVQASSERTAELARALRAAGFDVVGIVADDGDVHGCVSRLAPDAVLIDAESPTRDTLEGLALISKRFPRPILMLSDSADTDLVQDAALLGISAYVVEGFSPPLLKSLIEVSMAHFHTRAALTQELQQARQALGERRQIDQAKRRLMQQHQLGEDEAYHRLRRQAMSRGLRIAELAREILAAPPEP
jgi:response regulator NasT